MAKNTHVYLMQEDDAGNKRTVYPITDANAIIGLGNKNGSLLEQIEELRNRLTALENKVNYH